MGGGLKGQRDGEERKAGRQTVPNRSAVPNRQRSNGTEGIERGRHSRGATLYINPTNGYGEAVEPRKGGRKVDTIYSDGPYRSAADDFKL
jgi:hypothetical protein